MQAARGTRRRTAAAAGWRPAPLPSAAGPAATLRQRGRLLKETLFKHTLATQLPTPQLNPGCPRAGKLPGAPTSPVPERMELQMEAVQSLLGLSSVRAGLTAFCGGVNLLGSRRKMQAGGCSVLAMAGLLAGAARGIWTE